MITQSTNLNLIPGKVLPRVNAVQYDYGSRILEFPIWNGEQRFILTGAMTARIQGTKPDRLGFDYAATVDTTNNIITADLTDQMTPISGEVMCEIVLKKSNERIGTLNFVLAVQPAALNDQTSTSKSDLPDIIALAEEQMHAAAASATKAQSYAEGGTNTRPGEDTDNAQYYASQAETAKQAANSSATSAASNALKAEGFANGKQNGQAVPGTSPYYHNNAEYFMEEAQEAAQEAEAWSEHPPYIGPNGNWFVYNITDHEFVDSGIKASVSIRIQDITMLNYDATPYVTNSGTATDPVFHLYLPRGSSVTGCGKIDTVGLIDTYRMTFSDGFHADFAVMNGKGIRSITKTDTTGLLDTYTITFNDGTTQTYIVTNGKGIRSITKTNTTGLLDTYTITFNDGTTQTYTVTNGKGIQSIVKTDTTGLVDTYTITFNDGTTQTYTVTNGRDGIGSQISSLSDVSITSPDNKDGLVYNSATGKWENQGLKNVAFTGSFSDLADKPEIDDSLDTTSTNAVENKAVAVKVEEWEELGLSVVNGEVCQTYDNTTP